VSGRFTLLEIKLLLLRVIININLLHFFCSDAVDVRQQLDLRIGAAFTRFLTLGLQQYVPRIEQKSIISYGSCQFPTLGFVVERWKQRENFVPQPFWFIDVVYTKDKIK